MRAGRRGSGSDGARAAGAPPGQLTARLAALLSLVLAWLLLGSWQVRLGWARDALSMVADLGPQPVSFPLWPWLLCVAGAAVVWRRRRRVAADDSDPTAGLLAIVAALLGLRALSLWTPAGVVLPWLGLLWSPEADWALALTCCLRLSLSGAGLPPWLDGRTAAWRQPSRIAAVLFAAFAAAYACCTLYFCQMAMPHGDEGQYLRVTQSLVHDGDLDLADDLEAGQTREFHPVEFDLHPSPSAPSGRVYSLHPVGLSALLVPAYALGLDWWGNPRLGCALTMAVLAAGCVGLAFLLLVRLGFRAPIAAVAALTLGTTAPLFTHCNQLYPDVPGTLAVLAVLTGLAHWLAPGGGYRDPGPAEPALLAGAVGLLGCLPFLHPRMAFMALPPAALVALQAWHSPRRARCLQAVAAAGLAGLALLLAYNLTVSSDWLGSLRPGKVIPAGAVSLAALPRTLPGHWLSADQGLANGSPVYLLAWLGWGLLAWRRDRRALAAFCLWSSTGAVCGLLSYWDQGFTLSGRLLLTSLPALLIGLAAAVDRMGTRPAGLFVAMAALVLSWESVLLAFPVPEMAYEGQHLSLRAANRYYPWEAHFTARGEGVAAADLGLWIAGLAGLGYLLFRRGLATPLRAGLLMGVLALPGLWGQTGTAAARLRSTPLSTLGALEQGRPAAPPSESAIVALRQPFLSQTGDGGPDGWIEARAGAHGPGILRSYHLPVLYPGTGRLAVASLTSDPVPGSTTGAVFVTQRATLLAAAPWMTRYRLPLADPLRDEPAGLEFPVDRPEYGTAGVEFSGLGSLAAAPQFYATVVDQRLSYREVPVPATGAPAVRGGGNREASTAPRLLAPGRYRVTCDLGGRCWASWFRAQEPPVFLAVYAADPGAEQQLAASVRAWFDLASDASLPAGGPGLFPPLVEKVQALWWTTVPFAGRRAYSMTFLVDRPRLVSFLMRCDGPQGLALKGLDLVRLQPRAAGGGE